MVIFQSEFFHVSSVLLKRKLQHMQTAALGHKWVIYVGHIWITLRVKWVNSCDPLLTLKYRSMQAACILYYTHKSENLRHASTIYI